MKLTDTRRALLEVAAVEGFKAGSEISRNELTSLTSKHKLGFPYWLTEEESLKLGRGLFKIPETDGEIIGSEVIEEPINEPTANVEVKMAASMPKVVETNTEKMEVIENLIPDKDPLFVKFGGYNDLHSIIKSKFFYPIFITGLSGNGKTFTVEQVCAIAKRELIRTNVTIETDEDDLLGGFRLVNGETVWHDGPVIQAMKRGAILLLDEVDLASNKIMCLQPVLEGKGVFLKKINQFVKPAKGFNVVATANTKGKGSEDGRFMFTNVLNEAFLERFPITIEQEYPTASVEKKILIKVLESVGKPDEVFAEKLTAWADIIRKTFFEGGLDEIIATRRLVHICNAFAIFNGDRLKSIEMCVSRFDEDTKQSFLDLYTKVDADVSAYVETSDEESLLKAEDSSSEEEKEETYKPF
tara:strand:+ start:781 stop:2019 length:1239 start_codon:yes stop_codon:yes gene_type:complete